MSKKIFIVGTGRSGTKAFANALNGYHEYGYKTNNESNITLLFKSKETIFERDPFQNNPNLNDWILEYHNGIDKIPNFICADNTYCFFLKELYELYPDSKILHIVRDGRDTAPSMLNREWHRYNNFGHYPMKDDSLYNDFFHKYTDLQKVAWIWKDRINRIITSSSQFTSDRYQTYRIEDCSDINVIHSLQQFLDIKLDVSKLFSNINSNSLNRINYKDHWSQSQLNEYNDVAYTELKYFNYV